MIAVPLNILITRKSGHNMFCKELVNTCYVLLKLREKLVEKRHFQLKSKKHYKSTIKASTSTVCIEIFEGAITHFFPV